MTGPFDTLKLDRHKVRLHHEDAMWRRLHAVARNWAMIASLAFLAVALAASVVALLPRAYTAEALVLPELFTRQDAAKPAAAMDGAALVASEVQLIRSRAIARAVAARLGLDRTAADASSESALSRALQTIGAAVLPERVVVTPADRAVAAIMKRLSVSNDARSYLIGVAYTARSPEEAARVANAFALEYVQAKKLQGLNDDVVAARRELAQLSVILGAKHPSIIRAQSNLATASARLEAARRPDTIAQESLSASQGVTLAEPSPVPSSPQGLVILTLALCVGLACGVAAALWRERDAPRLQPRPAFEDDARRSSAVLEGLYSMGEKASRKSGAVLDGLFSSREITARKSGNAG